MRIIDNRKDYYDGVILYAPQPVWVRKERSYALGSENPHKLSNEVIDLLLSAWRFVPKPTMKISGSSMITNYGHAIVFVCGTAYVVYYKKSYLDRPQDIISADCPSRFVDKWNASEKWPTDHIALSTKKTSSILYHRTHFTDHNFRKWNDQYQDSQIYHELHRKFMTPVWMITGGRRTQTLTINPLLCNVGFQCVISPWDMFQKLERYVGNDLVDTPLDNFKMSDELKRDSKGMDKWSFKQRGPKQRKRK